MKTLKFTAALVALASVALVGGTAKATTSFNAGDIFLGVEDITNPSGSDYEVDLGNISTFQNFTGTIDLGNVSADLTTAFGASPFSNGNLNYGIIGTSGNLGASGYVANTIFISNPQIVNGVPNVPNLDQSNGLQGTQRGIIATFEGGTLGAFAPEAANGAVFPDATILPAGGADSFSTLEGGTGFGTGDSDLATLATDEDLTVNVPTTVKGANVLGTDLGYFSFSTNGDLLYTSYAIATPEPSTYALLAIGALVGFWQFRRASRA